MAARDPYKVLGLSRNASDADIKRIYRKLAKAYHPDANRDDPKAQRHFSDLGNAYALLSDKDKRQRFDRGEIDAAGNPRIPQGFHHGHGKPRQPFYSHGGMRAEGGFRHFGPRFTERGSGSLFDDLFSPPGSHYRETEGGHAWAAAAPKPMRLPIAVEDAIQGTTKQITLPSGRKIAVRVPKLARDGQQIRLRGQRSSDQPGAPDLTITLHYLPHALYLIHQGTGYLSVPISLREAVHGAKIEVPTLEGIATVSIPPRAQSGQRLRLRGRGAPTPGAKRGDLILTIMVNIPLDTPEVLSLADRQEAPSGTDLRAQLAR